MKLLCEVMVDLEWKIMGIISRGTVPIREKIGVDLCSWTHDASHDSSLFAQSAIKAD